MTDGLAAWNERWATFADWQPLRVVATLRGAVAVPNGAIAIDSLLGAAVASRFAVPPPLSPSMLVEIGIPIARERDIYLCSLGEYAAELHEHRWVNRRFPVSEAQNMGEAKFRRITISTGPCKSYRLPLDTVHVEHDVMTWWAVGEVSTVLDLLENHIHYLGKKRSVGLGAVTRWEVEPIPEPWPGFPVLRDGLPTRPLPLDWPGLSPDAEQAYRVLSPPYWRRDLEVLAAIPGGAP
jgi:hypothetical protein